MSSTKTAPKTTLRPLIREVARRSGISLGDTRAVYDALLETILENACAGTATELTGFGTFRTTIHKGHPQGFNAPPTDAYPVLKFTAAKALRYELRA